MLVAAIFAHGPSSKKYEIKNSAVNVRHGFCREGYIHLKKHRLQAVFCFIAKTANEESKKFTGMDKSEAVFFIIACAYPKMYFWISAGCLSILAVFAEKGKPQHFL